MELLPAELTCLTRNHRIRRVDLATGEVSTLAGSGSAGYRDDTGTSAQFNGPTDVAPDGRGGVYTVEQGSLDAGLLRHIDKDGTVTSLAGRATMVGGFSDGTGTEARFYGPRSIAADAGGQQAWIADTLNDRVRRVELPPAPPS